MGGTEPMELANLLLSQAISSTRSLPNIMQFHSSIKWLYSYG